jgi:hypothetical protein
MTLDEMMAHVKVQLAEYRALKGLFDDFVGDVFGLIDAELPLHPQETGDGSLGFHILGRAVRVTFSAVYDSEARLRGAIRLCHVTGEGCMHVPIGAIFFDLDGNTGEDADGIGRGNSFGGRPDRVRHMFLEWMMRFLASDEFRVPAPGNITGPSA